MSKKLISSSEDSASAVLDDCSDTNRESDAESIFGSGRYSPDLHGKNGPNAKNFTNGLMKAVVISLVGHL